MKKLLSIVLVMAMLLSMSLAIPVSADTTTETVSKWDGTLPEKRYNFTVADSNAAAGTETNPYLIQNARDLSNLVLAAADGQTWEKYFSLTCDIDMNGHTWSGIGNASAHDSKRFEGIFLGNGHVIYNLKLASNTNSGFFNVTQSATIKDLGIASGTIDVAYEGLSSEVHVGALIGMATGGTTISNCFSCADINVKTTNSAKAANVGLLIGKINTTTTHSSRTLSIIDCWVDGNISSTCTYFDKVGGLVGCHGNTATVIEDCTVICAITRNKPNAADRYGAFVADNSSTCTLNNSKAYLTVKFNDTGSYKDTDSDGVIDTVPTYTPGAFGYCAGTITITDCYRHVIFDTSVLPNGSDAVNPTPTYNDTCTATTDEIKLTTTTMLSNNFAQNGIDNNAGNIRFVSELGFSAGAFSETGYVVEFATKSAEIGGKVVYTSLKAADAEAEGGYKTLTPTGKYYIAYGISDIPTTVSGTVTVTPYVVLLDGTTTVYGASAEYTITAGVLQQNS